MHALRLDSCLFTRARPFFHNKNNSISRSYHRHAKIDIESLSNTLEEQRFANRTVTRRVRVKTPPSRLNPPNDPLIRKRDSHLNYNLSDPGDQDGNHTIPMRHVSHHVRELEAFTKWLETYNLKSNKMKWNKSTRAHYARYLQQHRPRRTPPQDGRTYNCQWLDYIGENEEVAAQDGMSRLRSELMAFERFMDEIKPEGQAAQTIIDKVTTVLKPMGENMQPFLVGSRHTGMAVRHSDIDLMMLMKDPDGREATDNSRGPSETRPKANEVQNGHLQQAADLLFADPEFSAVIVRTSWWVPAVTAIHKPTGIAVNLYCGVKPPSSLEYILQYKSEFPTLRPLYIALRMVLEMRNKFGLRTEAFTAYPLITLIVAALKFGEGRYDRLDISSQFIYVLQLYSTTDLQRYGVSAEPPMLFRKRGKPKLMPPNTNSSLAAAIVRSQMTIGKQSLRRGLNWLCIQDPADRMNDLGVLCDCADQFKVISTEVHADVIKAIRAWDNHPAPQNSQLHGKPCETPAADVIGESGPREELSLLRLALQGDYDRLDAIRDQIILGSPK
ncbi:hypothetical protein FQN57_005630 [Myotisia sp. PD_48]|nr:hypothetical protein FQN57_005630 [Myotisia sp. PD_48]